MKTCIDHLPAAKTAYSDFFACETTVGMIGNNMPALLNQPVPVLYYYRAAHLHARGSKHYISGIEAARHRIDYSKPLATWLYQYLSDLI